MDRIGDLARCRGVSWDEPAAADADSAGGWSMSVMAEWRGKGRLEKRR